MPPRLQRIRRERASDSVFDALRQGILNRAFQPGSRLDVKALADQLGVSPTPVKDALNRLAVEGLVDIRPRNGTFVAEFEPQDVAETFEIRRALECLAAERMVARATHELVARFRRLVEALDKPVDDESSRVEHERRNNELHLAIVEGSGNRRLVELYRNLNAHLTIARIHRRRRPDAGRLEQERREHRALLEALEARDAKRFVDVLDRHIRRGGQALVHDLDQPATGA
jgi:DNA-binding GntR family transcriptional regulator